MKKYLISLYISILCVVGLTAQPIVTDSVETREPISVDVRVKSDPMSIIISSEALEKNEALQETLKIMHMQYSILTTALKDLASTIDQKTVFQTNVQSLRKYDVNVLSLASTKNTKNILLWITIFICSAFVYLINASNPIYETKSNVNRVREMIRIIMLFPSLISLVISIWYILYGYEYELYSILQSVM